MMEPNFTTMTKTQLRTYLLEHREDEQALYIYLDKLHAENPNPKLYRMEDNVTEAIAEYLKSKEL